MQTIKQKVTLLYQLLLIGFSMMLSSSVWAQATNPFGTIVPQQTGTLDTTLAKIVEYVIDVGGLAVIGGGLIYGGLHILAKVKDANTSKEGGGAVMGSIAMSLVVILVTGVIGGILIVGAQPAGAIVAGIFA